MQAQNSNQVLNQAMALIQQRRFDQAVSLLGQLLSKQPGHEQAQLLMGVAHHYRGDTQASQLAFEHCLRINPKNADAWNNLGNTLVRRGDSEAAAHAFRRVLELASDRTDAAYNLAIELRKLHRLDEARIELEKLLAVKPDHAAAWSTLGVIQQDADEFDAALASYDRCLELDGSSLIALHNKSVILRHRKKYSEAVEISTRAIRLNPNVANVHQNLGSCYAAQGETEKAIAAYQRAVQLEPQSTSHHHWLNQLLWIEGRDDFLHSYYQVIKASPDAHELRRELVYKLILAERLDEALEHSNALVGDDPSNPFNYKLLGGVLRKRRRFDEALEAHRKAYWMNTDNAACKEELATSYLAAADAHAALQLLEELILGQPLHQGYLALKATALRILGSEEYHDYYDYDRLLLCEVIEPPAGYSSLADFNHDLREQLLKLHISKEHPLDQTLVNGTQTIDDLFMDPEGPAMLLQQCFDKVMYRFLERLPMDPSHPTLARNRRGFNCTGAWSVLLRQTGFHKNHYHSAGWYSGPYYVDLPKVVDDVDRQEGWIKFGEPSFECVVALPPDRIVKPEPGLMVRFPSYMWHGTIPFNSEEKRLVVSVDLDPGEGSSAPVEAARAPEVGGPSSSGIASF